MGLEKLVNSVVKKGVEIEWPIPSVIPEVMVLKASMTAAAMFDVVNNAFNAHKGDISDIVSAKFNEAKLKAQVLAEQFQEKLNNIREREHDQNKVGGSIFSQEDCTFF